MPYSVFRPALVGVDETGRIDLLADDDGPVLTPTWAYNSDGIPFGLIGPDGAPSGVPVCIASSGVPAGIPSSGTVGANGALSGITAFPITYAGIWLYFPAGAVFSGSPAGFYWTVMSSTTAGTIYNNRLSGTESPYVPEAPTPISAAGPGAYTQTTGVDITVCTHTIPGGLMGANGVLTAIPITRHTNNTNTKTLQISSGGTFLLARDLTTSTVFRMIVEINNRGTPERQIRTNWTAPGTVASDAFGPDRTINTADDWPVSHQLSIANAADYIVLERCYLSVTPRS